MLMLKSKKLERIVFLGVLSIASISIIHLNSFLTSIAALLLFISLLLMAVTVVMLGKYIGEVVPNATNRSKLALLLTLSAGLVHIGSYFVSFDWLIENMAMIGFLEVSTVLMWGAYGLSLVVAAITLGGTWWRTISMLSLAVLDICALIYVFLLLMLSTVAI